MNILCLALATVACSVALHFTAGAPVTPLGPPPVGVGDGYVDKFVKALQNGWMTQGKAVAWVRRLMQTRSLLILCFQEDEKQKNRSPQTAMVKWYKLPVSGIVQPKADQKCKFIFKKRIGMWAWQLQQVVQLLTKLPMFPITKEGLKSTLVVLQESPKVDPIVVDFLVQHHSGHGTDRMNRRRQLLVYFGPQAEFGNLPTYKEAADYCNKRLGPVSVEFFQKFRWPCFQEWGPTRFFTKWPALSKCSSLKLQMNFIVKEEPKWHILVAKVFVILFEK